MPAGSTQTAADVEYNVTALDLRPLRQFPGGRPSTNVKLVNGSQIIEGQRIEVLSRRFKCTENLIPKVGYRVVL